MMVIGGLPLKIVLRKYKIEYDAIRRKARWSKEAEEKKVGDFLMIFLIDRK